MMKDNHIITSADKLTAYSRIDHYPDCDGESDRWSTQIIGVNDQVFYSARK